MIFNFVLDSSQIYPYIQGVKKFFVVDDVDNIFVGDYLMLSDYDTNVIYHVDYIDKSDFGLKEGQMILSLSPCEIITKCDNCVDVYKRQKYDDELPFSECVNTRSENDMELELPFT